MTVKTGAGATGAGRAVEGRSCHGKGLSSRAGRDGPQGVTGVPGEAAGAREDWGCLGREPEHRPREMSQVCLGRGPEPETTREEHPPPCLTWTSQGVTCNSLVPVYGLEFELNTSLNTAMT